MAFNAFTAGVKPGGLNDSTEIRILLCYLIKEASPLTRENLESALMGEELVNYFEMVNALNLLEQQQLIVCRDDTYTITDKGRMVADTLCHDIPRSVQESAIRAVIRAQTWVRKAAQNHAEVQEENGSYYVQCSIRDMGSEVFSLRLNMPDRLTAESVRDRFIEGGSEIYALLLNTLTQIEPQKQ